VGPRVSSAFGTAAKATGDVGSHIRFQTPGSAANSNFIQAINRNVMPLPARATGTHGLPSGITSSQAPTLGGVAERYGASTSASRLGGHGAPHQGTSQLGSISEHQASHASGVSGGGVVMSKAPKVGDVGTATSSLDSIRLRNQLIAEQISKGHALEKHIVKDGDFLGWIRTRTQLREHIEHVLNDPSTSTFSFRDGRSAYVHRPSNTVIVRDPKSPDGGTIFQPKESVEDFLKERKWR
jgi:hypothetical protein